MATAGSIIGGELYPAKVLRDGAVGYWRLGEPSGTTLVDSVASPHNGTYAGGVTLAQTGALADGTTAALFNGTTGKATVATFNPLSGLAAVTLEGWVNHNSVAWSGSLEIFQSWNNTGHYLSVNTGLLFGSLKISGVQRTLFSSAVPTSGWHHLALTWASGDGLRCYLDGLFQNVSASFSGTLDSAAGVNIGSFDGTQLWFNGFLDEIATYPTALTVRQVAEHYGLRLAVACGLRASGAAPIRQGRRVTGSSGVRVGGVAPIRQGRKVIGAGGIRVGGVATTLGLSVARDTDVVVQVAADDVVIQPAADDVVIQVRA